MWAHDFLAKHPNENQVINDSKTPSGPVHIGSFRSLIIHDVLRRVIEDQKKSVTYFYGFDDYDPMDDIPAGFKGYQEHLGKPLVNIPAPDKSYPSFADQYISENKHFHELLGVKSNTYRTSELYKSGKFNDAIRKVLDNADKIRQIYLEVSGSKRGSDWFPVQVICPNCGKLGSSYVYDWNGQEVSFACRQDLVPWAVGCGHVGKISPFDGWAKMSWRVEWAAKWDLFGVTIEAAGKDHASKGGSFDTGMRILQEVLGKGPIAAFGHEMFNIDGKKMSSSKGLVVTPEQALSVFEPQVFRFLLVRNRPQVAIEIDLTEITPRTYDEYDRCQMSYLSSGDEDLAEYFIYSQINPTKIDKISKVRFSTVVNLVQLPSMTHELEKPEIAPRVPYAKTWLDRYAPSEMRFSIQPKLPDTARGLSDLQKKYLARSVDLLETKDGEELQAKLYQLAQEMKISSKDAFAAIYLCLIGKTSGPRAGMLLASLTADFIKKRFLEASR